MAGLAFRWPTSSAPTMDLEELRSISQREATAIEKMVNVLSMRLNVDGRNTFSATAVSLSEDREARV